MASSSALPNNLAAAAAGLSTPPAGASTKIPSSTPLRFRHPDFTSLNDDDVASARRRGHLSRHAKQNGGDDGDVASDEDDDDDYSGGSTTAVDELGDDNYVRNVLAKEKPLPPITWATLPANLELISTLALTIVPVLTIYGALTTPVQLKTLAWAILYYFYTVRHSLPLHLWFLGS